MTRGKFVLFCPEAVWQSTEFNGDMYFEGNGREAAEGMQDVHTAEGLEILMLRFNSRHYGYPEEEVTVTGGLMDKVQYGAMLDMKHDYFSKYGSDYLFIANRSGKALEFTLADGTHAVLPDKKCGVLHYGGLSGNFPPELDAFPKKEDIPEKGRTEESTAQIVLDVPGGDSCSGCLYRIRRTDIPTEDYHCAIFGTRATRKAKACVNAMVPCMPD